ncbi:MAG: hypothetical protein PHH54_06890 [Candidatus Nanoarchaeia archaeon]|nr:hypothetical protein [Candidatus Nanoarchaeia archaeon]MDD5741681.1 hypothetical protein [Candidatus Nanoarchaeia archaeon]
MSKKLILSSGILISLVLVLSLSLVSASGLCLGNDGYYHDCDNNRYFDYNKNYAHEYCYHGECYPTRDYYYREYYRPSCCGSNCNKDEGLTYKDTEEYKRTIEYNYEDRGVNENIKYTINEKKEINLNYDLPYLRYHSNNIIQNYNKGSDTNTGNWYDLLYDIERVPHSSGWYVDKGDQ